MISLILLKLFTFSQILQGVPKLSHATVYTATQKFGISKIFNVFKGVSSAHQGCIYSIKNTVKTVILWNLIALSNIGFLF